jgi:ABC-type phosphate/phosphonate transport system permease subunit
MKPKKKPFPQKKRPRKKKKSHKLLAWLIIVLLVLLIGMSLGFLVVLSNIADDGTLSPFLLSLKSLFSSVTQLDFATFLQKVKDFFPKGFPVFQSILTTIGGVLGIVVMSRSLKKK